METKNDEKFIGQLSERSPIATGRGNRRRPPAFVRVRGLPRDLSSESALPSYQVKETAMETSESLLKQADAMLESVDSVQRAREIYQTIAARVDEMRRCVERLARELRGLSPSQNAMVESPTIASPNAGPSLRAVMA